MTTEDPFELPEESGGIGFDGPGFSFDFVKPDQNFRNLKDIHSSKLLGYNSFEEASRSGQLSTRNFLTGFLSVAGRPDELIDQLSSGKPLSLLINTSPFRAIKELASDSDFAAEFIEEYIQILVNNYPDEVSQQIRLRGYRIFDLIETYKAWEGAQDLELSFEDYITKQVEHIGSGFEPYFDHIMTEKARLAELLTHPGKFRANTSPQQIARWECRIGASTFLIPPINIDVSQSFHTGSLTGGAIRQPSSPKTNLGHADTYINMTLYFPNHESIWGFKGETGNLDVFNWDPQPVARTDVSGVVSENAQIQRNQVPDDVVDRYLSSLRGLVTQFKFAPILPIRNEYLNRTYGIDAVTMKNMTVSTVPGFPFVLAVNLSLGKFNYKPLLPMIQDFDQAVHWGRYRQYIGRAAAVLDAKVNEGFLINPERDRPFDENTDEEVYPEWEGSLIPLFDKTKDWSDGRFFDFYYPQTTPSRIFAPDTSDFRQPGENNIVTRDVWDFVLSKLGIDVIRTPSFNFAEYATSWQRTTNERKILMEWLRGQSQVWENLNSDRLDGFLEFEIERLKVEKVIKNEGDEEFYRNRYQIEWAYILFGWLSESPELKKIQKDVKESGKYTLKEWAIPMDKIYIDWSKCIVQDISVNIGNKFARMQVQLQQDPTYQHIGGADSTVDVRMVVMGEENLLRIRRMFEHINGLARLEQNHGVLGFLGIKNVITGLCGIKYVLPLNFEVQTIPNMPHAYSVSMSFVDFDVMQQKREELSTNQQRKMVESFGKRNPFLRMKQMWSVHNGYPEFPLEIKDSNGDILGYMDPDWYFRSFETQDKDLHDWNIDPKSLGLVKSLTEITKKIKTYSEDGNTSRLPEFYVEKGLLERQLRDLIESSSAGNIPGVTQGPDGSIRIISGLENLDDIPDVEMRQYLGVYGEDASDVAFIDFFPGGYFALGIEDDQNRNGRYILGLTGFREDLASVNSQDIPSVTGTVPLSEYQNEYEDKSASPNKQYEDMMKDYNYRNIRGRMLKAFPTYMLWLIDEGGRFAGMRLFDNLYGLNSVIDFSVVTSEDSMDDTLVLRVSNMYEKLTTPFREQVMPEDSPLFDTPIGQWIANEYNRGRNIRSGLFNEIVELNNIRLRPGVRVHLRAGYGANANSLQTVFNGTITEVQQGDIMTIIAQSDAVELSAMVNSTDAKDYSGKLDGGLVSNLWLSEPRDLIIRLLTIGSSRFREQIAWASKGAIFSESRFGIRHFGHILYEPMTPKEGKSQVQRMASTFGAMEQGPSKMSVEDNFVPLLGEAAKDLSKAGGFSLLTSMFNSNIMQLANLLWVNSSNDRDYELFKRNVYPGNGTGIAQFMGGDMIDAGIIVGQITSYHGESLDGSTSKFIRDRDDVSGQTQSEIEAIANQIENNKKNIDELWNNYRNATGVTDEELLETLSSPSLENVDLSGIEKESSWFRPGLVDTLLFPVKLGWDLFNPVDGMIIDPILNPFGTLSDQIKHFFPDSDIANKITGHLDVASFFMDVRRPISSGIRLMSSPVGTLFGLHQAIPDDDLPGHGEVAFRAQTYMRTVWDLFKVCAALLPNYIVAVRPFEHRSTVFYGKPHWLYTSGVIPITTGVPADVHGKPGIVDPNYLNSEIMEIIRGKHSQDFEKLKDLAENTSALKDLMKFSSETNIDPYDVGGGSYQDAGAATFIIENFLDPLKAKSLEDDVDISEFVDYVYSLDFNTLTNEQVEWYAELWTKPAVFDKWDVDDYIEAFKASYDFQIQRNEDNPAPNNSGDINVLPSILSGDTLPVGFISEEAISEVVEQLSLEDKAAFEDLYTNDPISFAYHFGWKFSFTPVWIDPNSGYGYDPVGDLARRNYDNSYYHGIDVENGGREVEDAQRIWRQLRSQDFREYGGVRDVYDRLFSDADSQERFDEAFDLFLRFLWQDPYNRSWAILTPSVLKENIIETINPLGNNSIRYSWEPILGAWEVFLTNPISFDSNNTPKSGATRHFMEANFKIGQNHRSWFKGTITDVSDWMDQNIGGLLGIVSDTITGFVASIRLSLAQIGNALSMTGQMQFQANILNAAFNDSIYYSEGPPGSITRLVDNPFTREFGEPVIEVREPFQRVHYISSFDTILDNGITENLNDVATVVTAVSDGKYPVTVHLDKMMPADRQVEKTIETGIYWDNAVGSGLLGMFQPLIKPLETARAYTKAAIGSSDELTSRRIALAHLKEGLKNIYEGEILIIGDTDIRPYDLLYIGDVYERMYGMVEVEKVVHHFTPENGLVTAITPNAIVTVNDPARWTMLSYLWSKFSSHNIRNDTRDMMAVSVDRNVAEASKMITDDNVHELFSKQMQGGLQYTQGSTAIIKDISAMYTSNGIDEIWNQVAKYDIMIAGAGLATTAGAAAVGLFGGVGGAAIGAGVGFVAQDLMWSAWQWVKDNLLDQHNCYIQFLNKNGQPMDAGMSNYSGLAAGTNHTIELLPSVLGLKGPSVDYVNADGNLRITTDDLLGALGWSEVDTLSLYRETSMYVNNINKDILEISNRDFGDIPDIHIAVIKAEILTPTGEDIGDGGFKQGIIDGDTIDVRIIDGDGITTQSIERIRLSSVDTPEMQYKNNPGSTFNETLNNSPNDLGYMAYQYLVRRFSGSTPRTIAIRVDTRVNNGRDNRGERIVGVIFHNTPAGTTPSERLDVLEGMARRNPQIPFDSFLNDGRPYTLNWELVMTGYGNVDMRNSNFNSVWRDDAIN